MKIKEFKNENKGFERYRDGAGYSFCVNCFEPGVYKCTYTYIYAYVHTYRDQLFLCQFF
jgi:hypothetical protein